jgi:tight adherence protein C
MSWSPASFGLIVALGVALAGGIIVLMLLIGARSKEDRQLSRRVLNSFSDVRSETPAHGPLMQALMNAGARAERWLDPKGETAQTLIQAGWRGDERRALFYAVRGAVFVLAMLLWLMASSFGTVRPSLLPLMGFAAAALGLLIPNWGLRWAAKHRRERIREEVPMFIHVLVLLFEAGLSTRQAVASLVREGRGVLPNLGLEMEGALRQLDAGDDIANVFKNLSDVLAVEDLNSVLGVLRQVDRYGGEVRQPLLEALAVIESRNTLDLREKVNLISGRMTVVMVLFFFPALLIFVAGPAVISILQAFGSTGVR